MIEQWLEEVDSASWFWCVKRLSGNDTGLNGAHQVGPYIPRDFILRHFPQMREVIHQNAESTVRAQITSHNMPEQDLRIIWYNNKLRDGTRNETRITRWRLGFGKSPVLDHDNTGALCVFAFYQDNKNCNAEFINIWLCDTLAEEAAIENIVGVIEPSEYAYYDAETRSVTFKPHANNCTLNASQLPKQWLKTFPSGQEIIEFAAHLQNQHQRLPPDSRLLARRYCEFSLFKSIEDCHVLETINQGFSTVDEFISFANSVSNRRKSRSGKSLELHLCKIFLEEGLNCFEHDRRTEGRIRPDFIFPSVQDYQDPTFPAENLVMLAAKTTCKDRWRQILNEVGRVPYPHLVTLQEGISEHQFREMQDANVKLVVPQSIHRSFPPSVRPELFSLERFIRETKARYAIES